MKIKRANKKKDLIQLALSIAVVILFNFIGSFVFHRFDLTSEKRYTLSPATIELLKALDDVVYVKVYLEGEFPAGFKRLRNETREMLDEFKAYAKDNIEYEFFDPNANPDKNQREEIYRQLFKKGLQPTNLEVKTEEGKSEQIIFPGAIVTYKGKELPWQLLKIQVGVSPDRQLNNSVQALEYELTNTIRKLNTIFKLSITFLEGHNELDTLHVKDISESLKEYYNVERAVLTDDVTSLSTRDSTKEGIKVRNKYKAIIIAKPDSSFTEKQKFILDQFIMHGGKVLWLIDPVYTNLDSLARGYTMGLPNNMNLEDQLFKYGVRLNSNLILDLQAAPIPVNKGLVGSPPKWVKEPWLFNPLVMPFSDHPIVKNLDLIKFEFVSSIDTIATKGIKKTILLTSSKYSRTLTAPTRIALAMVNIKPDEKRFNQPNLPVAVLLEGEFESVFKNRLAPQIMQSKEIDFKDKSAANKMIVVSDGDIIKNIVQRSTGRTFPLGYDMTTQQTFANKTFLLNCVNYLCDDSGLLSVRAREVKLRLLDKKKITNEKLKWQLINTVVPILLIIGFGIGLNILRKRKYSS